MPRQTITSPQNEKIKLASKLTEKRQREKTGLFRVDDARDLRRALACGYEIEFLLLCSALMTEDDVQLIEELGDPLAYEVDETLMQKASYRQNPGGIVAILRQKPTPDLSETTELSASHMLGMVQLTKPGNIGALLRTADAAGFRTIFLIDTPLDIYNPNIIRTSTGTCFLNNLYSLTTMEAIAYFQRNQIKLLAAHLAGDVNLFDYDFTAGQTAVLVGAEDTGLDDIWLQHCDALVTIPMQGQMVDSLNVSVSGAIIMYEALRQHQSPRS